MCGIAGYFFFSQKRTTCRELKAMSAQVAHRGPDDEGFVFIDTLKSGAPFTNYASQISAPELRRKGVLPPDTFNFPHTLAMAHRRFSIIDLSPSGHQPMWDDEENLCVIFNGEIFNYIELREELKHLGVPFRTGSDTEVLLAAYRQWGNQAFQRFSGFWAIALFDRRKNRLVLSRDRIGKKPLYIYRDHQKLVWASEIKSIMQLVPASDLPPDEQSIRDYLCFGRRDVGHFTFRSGIKMADNAACIIVEADGTLRSKTFWQLPGSRMNETEFTLKDAQTGLMEHLKTALNERLRADVPIAFELSGGMDSSSLVALRAYTNKEPFSAFTVKYPGQEDESHFARQLARHYPNIRHHLIEFKAENLWQHLNDFQYLQEEPFHNPSLLVNQLLRRTIKARGYKVLISGSGGDEAQAGYTEYAVPIVKELRRRKQYAQVFKNILLYKEQYPLRLKPMIKILLNRFRKQSLSPLNSSDYLIIDQTANRPGPVFGKDIQQHLIANMTDRRMYYWMSSGDKTTMGIPIESRAPLLDHRVVQYLFSLPVSYLMRNGWLKWLLRKSMGGILPDYVRWRKQKMGFPFPLQQWMTENQTIIKGVFNQYAGDNQWVDNRKIVSDFDFIAAHDTHFLWRAFNVQLWYTRVVCDEIIPFETY